MSRSNPLQITPTEMARALGKTNPDPVRAAPAPWHLPGSAYQGPGRKWVYDVPRAAFMEFVRTGRVPE